MGAIYDVITRVIKLHDKKIENMRVFMMRKTQ